MRLDLVLFAMLLVMCAVLVGAYFVQEQPVVEVTAEDGTVSEVAQGHGAPNEGHATMLSGGDGAARYENVWWLALLFGLTQIVFFLAALAVGGRKKSGYGPLKMPIVIGGIAYAIVFAGMILSHRSYVDDDNPALFLGFPIPTAWMMYGVWLVPLVFMFLYLIKFDDWFFTEKDRKKFDEIVARQGERPES
jgi:hypothetical protein